MTVAEYNRCVDLYSDSVYRFVLKSIKDSESAHDIVQESFLKMWEKVTEINGESSKSYLFTTAYHLMIDTIHQHEREPLMDESTPIENVVYPTNFDVQEVLHHAIERLPQDQKSVLLLRDYEGYSYQEIEKITGLKEAQVKVYIYRARLFLKQYIGQPENVI
ncbi:MAG: RNA polymerase sigma factor [Bacteroidales bacterium]|nr:RNA polymerase sigma factor [Bacteroidales bacterium]